MWLTTVEGAQAAHGLPLQHLGLSWDHLSLGSAFCVAGEEFLGLRKALGSVWELSML